MNISSFSVAVVVDFHFAIMGFDLQLDSSVLELTHFNSYLKKFTGHLKTTIVSFLSISLGCSIWLALLCFRGNKRVVLACPIKL